MRTALVALVLLGGAADDELREKLGCNDGCKILSVEHLQIRPSHTDVAVRTRRTGHCGVVADWTLLDADLKLLLTVDEEVDRTCSGHDEHRRVRVVIDKSVIRAGDHSWRWNGERFTDSAADSRRP